MATHSVVLLREPLDRGAWQVWNHRLQELDD